MDSVELIRSLLALLFVLALIIIVAKLARRYAVDKNWQMKSSGQRRLEVIERLTIDPRRQLVLIRRDNREHLLMLGQNEALAIENIDRDETKHVDA